MRLITLLISSILLLFLSGCCSSERYNTDNVGVGVSAQINSFGDLDLSEHLDASKIPSMIQESYKDGLKNGKKKEELQRYVVRDLSQKLREVSTIDLDADGTTDPILVVPEGDNEQMTFSIRVPDPNEVKKLPDLSDTKAWQDIAENKAVEVVAVTAVPRTEGGRVSSMEFEARPNTHYYSHNDYYYRSSFRSDLLTYLVVRDLFFRPYWYGPSYYSWYGGYYRPYSVRNVYTRRTTTLKKYNSGKSTFGRMTTQSGRIPARSANSKTISKKSFSSAKKTRNNLKSGGFGRGSGSSSSSRSRFGRSSSKSSSRGWFSGRSSSGGSRWGK